MITAFYLAILSIIYLSFTLYVISIRRSKLISLGDGGLGQLKKAIRVHGNFIEFTPLFIIMMYFSEIHNLPTTYLHSIGLTFVIGRISHAIGIMKPKSLMIFRMCGMILTLTSYIVLISILLVKNIPLIF